jgi:hypothetical protein
MIFREWPWIAGSQSKRVPHRVLRTVVLPHVYIYILTHKNTYTSIMSFRIARSCFRSIKFRTATTHLRLSTARLPIQLPTNGSPVVTLSRSFTQTTANYREMSEGAHPHLKIAQLFDVSDLNVAVTVSRPMDSPFAYVTHVNLVIDAFISLNLLLSLLFLPL